MRALLPISLLALVIGGAGCGGSPAIEDCQAAGAITPICGFENPEDLVPSPSGGTLLISQYRQSGVDRGGSLVAFQVSTGEILERFPGGGRVEPIEGWGEVDCQPPDPALFAPHGIDIERIVTGEYVLYAVNHGGRESVEMFEVHEAGTGLELIWRGCVMAPDEGNFNDLVVLESGEFRVSQMYPRSANPLWIALRSWLTNAAAGFVYHWSPAFGFERLPGTEVAFANGVEQTADARFVYVDDYLGNRVIKVDTESGAVVAATAVTRPDNLSWTPEGKLLVASHVAALTDLVACGRLDRGSCGFRFQIVELDPVTLATRVLLDHGDAPMGGATVAVALAGDLYLGTFAGDRIARVAGKAPPPNLPSAQRPDTR